MHDDGVATIVQSVKDHGLLRDQTMYVAETKQKVNGKPAFRVIDGKHCLAAFQHIGIESWLCIVFHLPEGM